jgi:hypothetical protein
LVLLKVRRRAIDMPLAIQNALWPAPIDSLPT